MPRPVKCRKVCRLPEVDEFIPAKAPCAVQVTMTVDEYETIRLIDHRGFTQEECCRYMNVSRTTVQDIYDNARKKIAQALVEGKRLVIGGGSYSLCDGKEPVCGCGGCKRHCLQTNRSIK